MYLIGVALIQDRIATFGTKASVHISTGTLRAGSTVVYYIQTWGQAL